MPVVVHRQMPGGSDVRKLRGSRSCSTFETVVDVPAGAVHRQDPHRMTAMVVGWGFWRFLQLILSVC